MDFTIDTYSDKDRDAVIAGYVDLQEVERAFTDTRHPGLEIAAAYIDALLETIDAQSGRMFVASDGEKMAGFVACWVEREENVAETDDSTTYGYIPDAYVSPEYRGTGLFQTLNAKAEEYLTSRSEVKRIRINVLAKNTRALNAYRKAGYEDYEIMLEKRVQ